MNNFFKYLSFFIVVSFVYLNLTSYLGGVGLIPFPSYLIDILFFSLFLYVYFKNNLKFPWENKIFIWLFYYSVLHLIYYIASPGGVEEFKYFKLVIFFIFFIAYISMFFNLDDNELNLTNKVLIPLGVIATITLIIDYVYPGYFFELGGKGVNEFYEIGRSASVYLNSNIAGGAMVIFLIFTIDSIPKKWRIFYITILFLGLFTTMSRSNIMIFFMVLLIMFFQKKLLARQVSFLFATIFVFFAWLSMGGLETMGKTLDFEVTDNMMSRVNFFADNKKSDTGDMSERKEILRAALEMFMDKPVFGYGFAATRLWEYRVSPHNTFVMHWAEFGFFGLLIIPLLLFLVSVDIFKYGSKTQKDKAILIIIFFSVSCFFSHNMLEQQLDVAALVALSIMGLKSKKNFNCKV